MSQIASFQQYVTAREKILGIGAVIEFLDEEQYIEIKDMLRGLRDGL